MDKNPCITIFTPTYNRAYTLSRLYNSLKDQKYKRVEWLIVDDGSSDNTKELINSFISEAQIDIIYIYQENQGKHIAINNGLNHARGELFFMVDSDDYLAPNALSITERHWDSIKEKESYGGIIGQKNYINGEPVGQPIDYITLDCKYTQYPYRGDKALIFRTDIFRQYQFPHFPQERFCDEALIWNRISGPYKLRFVNDVIMIGDYIADGLTQKMVALRYTNFQSTMLFFKEASNNKDIPLKKRIKFLNSYWRFSKHSPMSFTEKWTNSQQPLMNIISFPASYFKRFKDRKKLK